VEWLSLHVMLCATRSVEYESELNHLQIFFVVQEFSPGSNGRKTTMGVYVRDLILGQVCCLTSAFRMEIRHTVSLINFCADIFMCFLEFLVLCWPP
jgi:hypothetical protein